MISSQILLTRKKKNMILDFITKDVYLLVNTIKSMNKQEIFSAYI